jgi:hypothetical protein
MDTVSTDDIVSACLCSAMYDVVINLSADQIFYSDIYCLACVKFQLNNMLW